MLKNRLDLQGGQNLHSYDPMIFPFVPFHELSFVRFWQHQKTEVEEIRQNEVEKKSHFHFSVDRLRVHFSVDYLYVHFSFI